MKSRKLKKSVMYGLYALSFITIIGTIYILEMVSKPVKFNDDTEYVNDVIIDDEKPVASTKKKITRPFVANNISIARNFYDYKASEEEQKNALVYYQDTYIPNSGVDYKSDEVFDIVAILDGKVSKVTENSLLGKVVEVTHSNSFISVYQSLSELNVIEGDDILQGQVIGKSGSSNLSPDLGNHLHFEIIHNGTNANPENYYDKNFGEI